VGTIVSFHAHPDDESIGVGGTLARAADAGHRVVLVFATRGELGEPVPGVLRDGEQLALRRSAECHASAAALGAARVEFLGWSDSGMMGEPTNDAPYCFWRASVEHAARRLAVVLEEERPEVLTVYDDNGGYGHPDHIQVHRVGMRAAQLCPVPVVAQSTIDRDRLLRDLAALVQAGLLPAEAADLPPGFGKPSEVVTHRVHVGDALDRKRASMRAHASQMGPDHYLLELSDPSRGGLSVEDYIVDGLPDPVPGVFTELFTPLR
jgi:LmbE family N-acetylglucosaminyl deacetylase